MVESTNMHFHINFGACAPVELYLLAPVLPGDWYLLDGETELCTEKSVIMHRGRLTI